MPRQRAQRVTLRDIAARAGVSAMTVSRALSGRSDLVSAETARRIVRLASELGYVPNLLARSLRGEQIPTLVVFSEYISSHHYLAELTDYVARAVEARKYGVIACQSLSGLTQALQQFNLAGAVVIAPPESMFFDDDGLPRPPIAGGTPIVVLHCAIEQSTYPEVSPDIETMARQAADHLLDLGHRDLAFLGGPTPELEPHWFSVRRAGIVKSLEQRGLSANHLVFQPCPDIDLGESSVQQLLRRAPQVTGVICLNDEIAVAAISGLEKLGRNVPQDISIVGSNDVRWAKFFRPRLTTISIDIRALVETGLNLLFDYVSGRLRWGAGPPEKNRLLTHVVERDSTARAPNPSA